MNDAPTTDPKQRRGARRMLLAAAPLLLIPAYFGVRAAVRAHVDSRIERSVGRPLPAFTLVDRAGVRHFSADLRGRIAVIHFLRSQCVNCEREKPAVKAFVAGLDAAEVVFWSVMTDPVEGFAEDVTAATLARAALTWPVLMADAAFMDALHGAGWSHVTPITYFADRSGTVVATLRGPQTTESLRAALQIARAGA